MKSRLAALFQLAFCATLTAQVVFEQQTIIDSSYGAINPRAIATADLNNDGFEDLLLAGNGDVVWVPATDGTGTFDKALPLIPEFVEANKIAAADFDGDNDQDIVVFARADNGSYEILYLENMDALGTFATPVSLANTDALSRLNMQVLDVDDDDDLDIAYSSNDNISWLENTDGAASFTDHYLLGTNDGFYTTDVDGDGISDFIADFGDDLRAYKLNADGSLSFLETMNTFSLNNDHKAGDIDGDGDNDIVTFFENGNTRQIHWYENADGLGTFANRRILFDLPSLSGSSNSDQKALEVIDLDGDELLDIVTFDSRRSGMSWYKNLGATVFAAEQMVSDEMPNISSIAIADIDANGSLDILATDFFQHEYAWFSNQDGLGQFSDKIRISSYAYFVNHVDYGDLDGDGDLDLVSSSHADHKVAWYENVDGQGGFTNIQRLVSTTTDQARDVFAVDMDGDEDLDLLLFAYLDATTDDYQLLWFENDGAGNFPTEHLFATTQEAIIRINYADVDGDGDMDVISGQEDSVLALYRNNGDGTFATPVIFSESGFAYLLSLQVADVDGDNDIDVLAAYNNNEIIWHENDGMGDLSTKHLIVEQMHYPSSIYAADVDGDDDLDVLFTNQFAGEVGYFLNEDGQGDFGEKIVMSEVPQQPSAIYSLDVDSDGDMDVITNSIEGARFIWYRNDGEANFEEPREISSLIGRLNHITSADINADGKADLMTSSYDDNQVACFSNLGTLFTNTITGVVRLDANADGCNSTDAGVANLLIQSDNGTNTFATFTQADGSFSFAANQQTFTTSITSALPNYFMSAPASHVIDFQDLNDSTNEADFCLEADIAITDLNVVVYPDLNDPRPGFSTSYRLVYKNNGAIPLSGSLVFQYDEAKLSFDAASEMPTEQTDGSLSFDYSDLLPFETRSIDLDFTLFAPPVTASGDELLTTVTITPTIGDANEADNTFELNQTVINSYDPNDIRVLEGEEITIEQADDYLHYIIRFQNTGTASAINIRVNNVLDDLFDWSSLQLEGLSHPGRVEISDGNLVDFIFDNINLPDSTSNEPASHGFIAYKIKPRGNVVVGDIFSNKADIYFDFNPPIITNTATTEIVNPVSVNDLSASSIRVYPNPAATVLTIESLEVIHSVRVYDLNGRLLQDQRPGTGTVSLDVAGWQAGLYFVQLSSNRETRTLKFVKQ
ncbi:MAG: T9SS type A sorting domain-containing protein [Bacteroidota bacterium]